jgi:hypothetical protein
VLQKSRKKLNTRSGSLDLEIPHSTQREKETQTHKTKHKGRMEPLKKNNPI